MQAAILNLPPSPYKYYRRGDTFTAISIVIKDKLTSVPIDLTGAIVRMQWRNKSGTVVRSFTTVDGTLSITSPETSGEIIINQFENDTEIGTHNYDIEVDVNSTVFTYLAGTVTIGDDVTK